MTSSKDSTTVLLPVAEDDHYSDHTAEESAKIGQSNGARTTGTPAASPGTKRDRDGFLESDMADAIAASLGQGQPSPKTKRRCSREDAAAGGEPGKDAKPALRRGGRTRKPTQKLVDEESEEDARLSKQKGGRKRLSTRQTTGKHDDDGDDDGDSDAYKPRPTKRRAAKAKESSPIVTPPAENPGLTPEPETKTQARRSGRKRAAPVRYDESNDDDVAETPAPKTRSQAAASKKRSRRGQKSANWDPKHVLRSPESVLVYANLVKVLSDPRAWELLKPEQQKDLASMVPACFQPETGSEVEREPGPAKIPVRPQSGASEKEVALAQKGAEEDAPSQDASPSPPPAIHPNLVRSVAFQSDVRLFQEDLLNGRLDPAWQKQALAAMERRARGDFDEWKERETEVFWGQKQKTFSRAIAGACSEIKMDELIREGCIQVGDVFSFSHSFAKGFKEELANSTGRNGPMLLIEKEAKIVEIADDHRLVFTYPPGQHKFSSPANGDDIRTPIIAEPYRLAMLITNEDGRAAGFRIANAWKDFRCLRNNQDMGSLWDIRELYYVQRYT
ncbi:Asx homology domain-containing protein [Lineolata rhizophorae]|uniref:Asx homology domain-containing protein n=1 Tax=Lineolata rhizophorae TaxID=578093 RepID=A0A6A6NSB3_9PEZI|nr:Asx homology domain-containing protein [Lineolata rhizophorae]